MLESYHKLQPKPKTIPELKDALQLIWSALLQKSIDNNSLPTAVQSSESLDIFRRRLKTELFERSYNWHLACQTTLLLRDSLSLSRSFLLWPQPWSLLTIMLPWHSSLIIIIMIMLQQKTAAMWLQTRVLGSGGHFEHKTWWSYRSYWELCLVCDVTWMLSVCFRKKISKFPDELNWIVEIEGC